MDCISIGLALLGVAFGAYTVATPITTIDQVTIGPLVAVAGAALALACLLALIGLVLVLLALVLVAPGRWRIIASYCVGVAFFVGTFLLADSWAARHLPPRQTSAAAIIGNLDVSA
ncbi:hypothetical protein A9975_34700 [Cupriavidus sp. UME77]|nr:hypothetical protein [Cupriavidus sp. UME77]